jgi:hypothetical protein
LVSLITKTKLGLSGVLVGGERGGAVAVFLHDGGTKAGMA